MRDYVTLTKPRIMSLLLLTGGAGVFVGAGGVPRAGAFALTMLGLGLACGGASALNHYLDRDIDLLMGERTARRPVASGRMAPETAIFSRESSLMTPWAMAATIEDSRIFRGSFSAEVPTCVTAGR